MLSVDEINLLKAQNEGLRKQNGSLQKYIQELESLIKNIKTLCQKAINQYDNEDIAHDEL